MMTTAALRRAATILAVKGGTWPGQKEMLHKSRMDQRTRERLPVLPELLARIHYTLPNTGKPVPLLQNALSKTDTERLLSPARTRRRPRRGHPLRPRPRRGALHGRAFGPRVNRSRRWAQLRGTTTGINDWAAPQIPDCRNLVLLCCELLIQVLVADFVRRPVVEG